MYTSRIRCTCAYTLCVSHIRRVCVAYALRMSRVYIAYPRNTRTRVCTYISAHFVSPPVPFPPCLSLYAPPPTKRCASPHPPQVCVRAVDSVRQHSTKCLHIVQTTSEPPVAGWVRNRAAAHRAFVPSLDNCFWGGFTAPEGTGGVRQFMWGIGTTPGGTEKLPFQNAPYTREGSVPPLAFDAATEYYCTVRAVTLNGQSVTASSPAFRVCPAVARAAVGVRYHPDPSDARTGTVCATWRIPAADPGAGCVVRLEWAIGHVPHGAAVRAFADATGKTGACVGVPLVDGSAYYVTVRVTGEGGVCVRACVLAPTCSQRDLGRWFVFFLGG